MAGNPQTAVVFPTRSFAPQAHVRVFQGGEAAPGKSLCNTQAFDDGSVSALVSVPTGTAVCAVGYPPDGDAKVTVQATAGRRG